MIAVLYLIIAVVAFAVPVWLLNRVNRDAKGRFTRNPWWEWVLLLLGVGIALLCGFAVAGCAKPPTAPPPRAEEIRLETKAATLEIGKAVDDLTAWMTKAHEALKAEIARREAESNARDEALRQISDDLNRAWNAITPIGPATQRISKLADEAKVETDTQTRKAEDAKEKLDDERSKFWSYKQRILIGSVVAILGVIIVVMMIVRAFGGPLVAKFVSELLWAIWKTAVAIVTFPFWFIDQLNKRYDAEQKQGETK